MTAGLAMMIVGGGLFWLGYSASHQETPAPTTSSHFRTVTPVVADADSSLFFWYGCSHCLKVEERIRDIGTSSSASPGSAQGQSASLAYIPAAMNPTWELHARLFYALDALGYSQAGHIRMMKAIQSDLPRTPEELQRFLASGVLSVESRSNSYFVADVAQVMSLIDSPQVNQQIAASKTLSSSIGLKGVPTLLVGDRDVLELGSGVGYDDMANMALHPERSADAK